MARYVRITVDTLETVTPDQMADLFSLYEQTGWFFFLKSPDTRVDTATLPEIKAEPGEKSPSKRLRDRLFVSYNARYGKSEGFEAWYVDEMDRIGPEVPGRRELIATRPPRNGRLSVSQLGDGDVVD